MASWDPVCLVSGKWMRSAEGRVVEQAEPAFGGRVLLWLSEIDDGGCRVVVLAEAGRSLPARIRIGKRVLPWKDARRGRLIVRRRGGKRLC